MGNKMATLTVVAAIWCACYGVAAATDSNGSYVVIGFGNKSCGAYLDARKLDDDAGFAGWLSGFLSARNYDEDRTYDLLGRTDLWGAMAWLENYCRRNPTDPFVHGVNELVKFLYPKRLMKEP